MTEGERFVGSLPLKTEFHDRNKRRSYELARRVAIGIVDDPSLLENGRAHLDRFMRLDAWQSGHYAMWTDLLNHDVLQIARKLLEDSPGGERLRDSQPVFIGSPPRKSVHRVPRVEQPA